MVQRPSLKLDLKLSGLPSPSHPSDSRKSDSGFEAEYELGARLGSGTVAVVKRAVCRADGREVAVKCIRTEDEEVRSFVYQEYKLLSSLHHRSIITVEALHESSFQLWMVMELCSDGDMQAYVGERGPFTESDVRLLFRHLLEAVDYLHQRRVVHRDVKPENCLLLDQATSLKVTDFNSAKVVGNGGGLLLTNRGTRCYCAPELLLGQMWNERVDIWACGLCLYFMVRGGLPFDSNSQTTQETFAAHKLPVISWGGVSNPIQDLTRRCLAVDMCDRPAAMTLLCHFFFTARAEQPFSWLGNLLSISGELCCSSKGNRPSRRPPTRQLALDTNVSTSSSSDANVTSRGSKASSAPMLQLDVAPSHLEPVHRSSSSPPIFTGSSVQAAALASIAAQHTDEDPRNIATPSVAERAFLRR